MREHGDRRCADERRLTDKLKTCRTDAPREMVPACHRPTSKRFSSIAQGSPRSGYPGSRLTPTFNPEGIGLGSHISTHLPKTLRTGSIRNSPLRAKFQPPPLQPARIKRAPSGLPAWGGGVPRVAASRQPWAIEDCPFRTFALPEAEREERHNPGAGKTVSRVGDVRVRERGPCRATGALGRMGRRRERRTPGDAVGLTSDDFRQIQTQRFGSHGGSPCRRGGFHTGVHRPGGKTPRTLCPW